MAKANSGAVAAVSLPASSSSPSPASLPHLLTQSSLKEQARTAWYRPLRMLGEEAEIKDEDVLASVLGSEALAAAAAPARGVGGARGRRPEAELSPDAGKLVQTAVAAMVRRVLDDIYTDRGRTFAALASRTNRGRGGGGGGAAVAAAAGGAAPPPIMPKSGQAIIVESVHMLASAHRSAAVRRASAAAKHRKQREILMQRKEQAAAQKALKAQKKMGKRRKRGGGSEVRAGAGGDHGGGRAEEEGDKSERPVLPECLLE